MRSVPAPWRCACGATSTNPRGHWKAGGWRTVDGQDLCPACAGRYYREHGSTLRPSAGPLPLMASAPELRSNQPPAKWKPPPEPRAPTAPKPKAPKPAAPPRPSVRERVERELLRDPARSNVAVAKVVGCDNSTVSAARRKLRERGDLPPAASSAIDRAMEALRNDPSAAPGAIARELGLPRHSVYRARAKLRRLDELDF